MKSKKTSNKKVHDLHLRERWTSTDPELEQAIDEARALWRRRCTEYVAKHGDVGGAVNGAGISILAVVGRQRKPRRVIVIAAHDVSPVQGACVWEHSVKEAVSVFAKHGIAALYECGNAD